MSDEKKKAQRKLADGLVTRARAGEDFAKLVKDYSEDINTKDTGGVITFPRGKVPAEIEAAAFALQTNQVSEVAVTVFGYHIIKLYEKLPAKKEELTEVGPSVKSFLKRQGLQKLVPGYITKLETAAGVEILDPELKKLMADTRAEEAAAVTTSEPPKKEVKK